MLFYPGRYDGQSLRLFGILPDKPYYRAFRLVVESRVIIYRDGVIRYS